MMRREKEKLSRTLGGIRDMGRVPSAVWIVDTNKEALAVGEARKLKIPVIAILDTNCDPDVVDYPIPGNDDAIRAVGLLTRVVADAVAEGLMARAGAAAAATEGEEVAAEPMPEWEREILEAGNPAAEEAAVEEKIAEQAEETLTPLSPKSRSKSRRQKPHLPKARPNSHGCCCCRRCQEAPGTHRCRNDGLQARPRRIRWGIRQGR